MKKLACWPFVEQSVAEFVFLVRSTLWCTSLEAVAMMNLGQLDVVTLPTKSERHCSTEKRKSVEHKIWTAGDIDFFALLANSPDFLGTGSEDLWQRLNRDQQRTSSPYLSLPSLMCWRAGGMMNVDQTDVVGIAVPGPPSSR